jgi:hypothetical protein
MQTSCLKIPALSLFALFFAAFALRAQTVENRYDALSRAILPILKTFAPENPQHALRLEGSLVNMTNQPAQLQNAAVSLAVQAPDKLLLRVTVNGQSYTLARAGQQLWAAPGAQIQALIDAIPKLPKPDPDFTLPPLGLPFPAKELVLLPILFQVADAGNVGAAGQTFRVLDVSLMPELAKSLKVQEWSARLWLRADDSIAQLKVSRPGWLITIALAQLQLAENFPEATWQLTPGQASDVLKMDPVQFKQLLDAAGREIRSEAKKVKAERSPPGSSINN